MGFPGAWGLPLLPALGVQKGACPRDPDCGPPTWSTPLQSWAQRRRLVRQRPQPSRRLRPVRRASRRVARQHPGRRPLRSGILARSFGAPVGDQFVDQRCRPSEVSEGPPIALSQNLPRREPQRAIWLQLCDELIAGSETKRPPERRGKNNSTSVVDDQRPNRVSCVGITSLVGHLRRVYQMLVFGSLASRGQSTTWWSSIATTSSTWGRTRFLRPARSPRSRMNRWTPVRRRG